MKQPEAYYQSPDNISHKNPIQHEEETKLDNLEANDKGGRAINPSSSTATWTEEEEEPHLVRSLSFWDGMGVLVGIMIGSGIFASAGTALVRTYF
jgi:hypothetical protein